MSGEPDRARRLVDRGLGLAGSAAQAGGSRVARAVRERVDRGGRDDRDGAPEGTGKGRLGDDALERALAALDAFEAGEHRPSPPVPRAAQWVARARRVSAEPDPRVDPEALGRSAPARRVCNAVVDLLDPADPDRAVGALLLRVPDDDAKLAKRALTEAGKFAVDVALSSVLYTEGDVDTGVDWRDRHGFREPLALVDDRGALLAVQPPAVLLRGTGLSPSRTRLGPDGSVLLTDTGGAGLVTPDGVLDLRRQREGVQSRGRLVARVEVAARLGPRTLPPQDLPDHTRLLVLVALLMPPGRPTSLSF